MNIGEVVWTDLVYAKVDEEAAESVIADHVNKDSHGPDAGKVEAELVPIEVLDKDHDGQISREEWVAGYGSEKGFDSADLNRDGVIDADEYLREEMRVKHRRKRHTELHRR